MNLLKNIAHYDIILASQSPRRRELLKGLDIDFRIEVIDVDESYPNGMMGVEIPMYLAEKKANAYRSIMQDNTLLITADTIVWHEGRVMNKPANEAEARQMLTKLSGKTHQVITGVWIFGLGKRRGFHVISEVRFVRLTDPANDYFFDNYKPYDKAGSYGVQEWIGFVGVEHINGSYFNVMGLPVQRLYNELKRWAE